MAYLCKVIVVNPNNFETWRGVLEHSKKNMKKLIFVVKP